MSYCHTTPFHQSLKSHQFMSFNVFSRQSSGYYIMYSIAFDGEAYVKTTTTPSSQAAGPIVQYARRACCTISKKALTTTSRRLPTASQTRRAYRARGTKDAIVPIVRFGLSLARGTYGRRAIVYEARQHGIASGNRVNVIGKCDRRGAPVSKYLTRTGSCQYLFDSITARQ